MKKQQNYHLEVLYFFLKKIKSVFLILLQLFFRFSKWFFNLFFISSFINSLFTGLKDFRVFLMKIFNIHNFLVFYYGDEGKLRVEYWMYILPYTFKLFYLFFLVVFLPLSVTFVSLLFLVLLVFIILFFCTIFILLYIIVLVITGLVWLLVFLLKILNSYAGIPLNHWPGERYDLVTKQNFFYIFGFDEFVRFLYSVIKLCRLILFSTWSLVYSEIIIWWYCEECQFWVRIIEKEKWFLLLIYFFKKIKEWVQKIS